MSVVEINQPITDALPAPGTKSLRNPCWIWIVISIAALAVRFMNLGADPPNGLPNEADHGVYVDEGYKTLAARNLILFKKERWHPQDDYTGWANASPITQRAFYFSFLNFGQSLESARLVSIVWFALLLLAFWIAFYRKYPRLVFAAGLLLLAFENVLFVFSRVALFEIALVTLLFATLLLLRNLQNKFVTITAIFAAIGIIAAFGVKLNAMYLLVPALFGIAASYTARNWSQLRFLLVCLFAAGAAFIPVMVVKLGYEFPLGLTHAIKKVDLFPLTNVVERFVAHPLLNADPFLVILAHTCALGLFLHRASGFARDPYRCAMISVVLLGSAILAFMGPGMLRYYFLILPAFILLVLEWWSEQKNVSHHTNAPVRWPALRSVAGMIVLILLVFDCIFVVGWAIRRSTGLPILPLLAVAIALAIVLWLRRHSWLSETILRKFAFVALLGFALFNTYKVTGYLRTPTWQVKTISREMTRLVPADAVIAGDWAPIFAIGTNLRVLYMDSKINNPQRLALLRPSHFLACDTDDGKRVQRIIEGMNDIGMGPPILQSQYAGRHVALYPLKYLQSEKTAIRLP